LRQRKISKTIGGFHAEHAIISSFGYSSLADGWKAGDF